MNARRKPTVELIRGNVAIIIALCALGLSIWQAQATIRHNHISVEPRPIVYFSSDAKKGKFGLYLSNNGMGPAYFDGFRLLVNGKHVSDPSLGVWPAYFKELNLNPLCFVFGSPYPKTSLRHGSEEILIEQNASAPIECAVDVLRLIQAFPSTQIEIKYQSIYGDKFQIVHIPYLLAPKADNAIQRVP